MSKKKFQMLELTEVTPSGWLKEQLKIQASGLSGILYDVWDSVGSYNGWLGGTGDNWERAPYFLDGILPLAYYLKDKKLWEIAQKYIDCILDSQDEEGNFGPQDTKDDWWSRMVALKVLVQYYEITKEERRRFIDLELCQLDKIYLTDLASYNHIVNQRNKLLKDIYIQPSLKDTLDIWDMQMAEYGRRLINKRSDFIAELNETVRKIHHNLTGGLEELEVIYEPSCTSEELEKSVQLNREKDMRMKLTSVGPHRDDLCVMANGIDIRRYGSQGQQRTAALSLKLSEIYMVKRKIKDTPILLLDDVLSELDRSRQNYLLDSISDIQTLITCTGLDDFISHQFQINKVFQVVQGTVSQPV